MSIKEEKTLIKTGDALGNEVIHYPITKTDCIDGLDDFMDQSLSNLKDGSVTESKLATGSVSLNKLSDEIKNKLDSSDLSNATGTLSIAKGGTGATSASDALANLTNATELALGNQSQATGTWSAALGYSSQATRNYSTALGNETQATGIFSTALGNSAKATETNATALGSTTQATGLRSTALGYLAQATGSHSTALGYSTQVTGDYSAALGYSAQATGNNSTALGYSSQATGNGSIALGYLAQATEANSIAIGSHAEVTTSNTIQLGSNNSLSTLSCRVALTVTSDERDKIDIKDTEKSLEFLNKIRTVTYKFNHRNLYHSDVEVEEKQEYDENGEAIPVVLSAEDEKKKIIKKKRQKLGIYDYDKEEYKKGTKKGSRGRVGVLAQQVQQALVDVYNDDNYADLITDSLYDINSDEIEEGMENTLGVNYQSFIPFLIDGVNILSNQNKELIKRIETLENAMNNGDS